MRGNVSVFQQHRTGLADSFRARVHDLLDHSFENRLSITFAEALQIGPFATIRL